MEVVNPSMIVSRLDMVIAFQEFRSGLCIADALTAGEGGVECDIYVFTYN